MNKEWYAIAFVTICFALNGMQKTQHSITPDSYFNKTLYEIKIFDSQLNKALSDANWNIAYMYFISYFKKPSEDRIQNIFESFIIIHNRIDTIQTLLMKKKQELALYNQKKQNKQTGFDPFDTKSAMQFLGSILAIPIIILEEAINARNLQNLKNGIEKAEQVLYTLNTYKTRLDQYLKPYKQTMEFYLPDL